MNKNYIENIFLIIPACSDLNRGDQALVLETKKIIEKTYDNTKGSIYMMATSNTKQCESYGLKTFECILKHPSRKSKTDNINYGILLKAKWGLTAIKDFLKTNLLLHKYTRKIGKMFLSQSEKEAMELFEKSKACFVKGGGFLHDYSGGMVGRYTMYFQTFHIRLASSLNKKVYVMPNSFGPFKSKKTQKMIKKILEKCVFVSARESISANGTTNGLNTNIPFYPDLAFFLDKSDGHNSKQKIDKLFSKENINTEIEKIVAITVRPYRFYGYDSPNEKYLNYKKVFVNFIEYLINQNYKVLLVVHTISKTDHENDEKCIDEIIDLLDDKNNIIKIKDNSFDCYDLKELYSRCNYVIGTRFHSVIFSLEQKVPCIAVTYGGNKGDGIMKDLELDEYAIKIGELSYDKLIEKLKKVENNRENYIKHINDYFKLAKTKYNEMIKMIEEVK